jgi:hypothetical protein
MAIKVPPPNRRQPDSLVAPQVHRAYQLSEVLNLSQAYVTRKFGSATRIGGARPVMQPDPDCWPAATWARGLRRVAVQPRVAVLPGRPPHCGTLNPHPPGQESRCLLRAGVGTRHHTPGVEGGA